MNNEITADVGVLSENMAKVDKLEKSIQAALKRKRKIIEESKLYTYNQLSEIYGLDGQALLDAVTAEHDLIQKFTSNGMTYDEISGLADDSNVEKQMSFSENENPYRN